MGVAVIVRDKELGLSVVAIHDLRNGVTEFQKTFSERLNVARPKHKGDTVSAAEVVLPHPTVSEALREANLHPADPLGLR